MNRRGRAFVVGMSLIAALLFYSGAAFAANVPVAPPPPAPPSAGEQFQTVTPQDGSVIKNDQLDHSNPEQSTAESVTNIGSGEIQMMSKTFEPPPGWRFVVFPGTATHVDIAFNPEGFDPERLKDRDDQIKIRMTFHRPVTAAAFVMRCEGPVEPPQGGGITVPHYFGAEVKEGQPEVDLDRITATIRPTAPLTKRNAGKDPQGGLLKQENEIRTFESTEKTEHYDAKILVLIRDSEPIDLVVDGSVFVEGNAADIRWEVSRNTADHNGLSAGGKFPAGVLDVTPTTGKTTTLSLNKVGSFSILVYFDLNKSKTLNADEHRVRLNVVSAQVIAINNPKVTPDTHPEMATAGDGKPTGIPLTTDKVLFDGKPAPAAQSLGFTILTGLPEQDPDPTHQAIDLSGAAEIYGGGAKADIGTDQVHFGWTNNILSDRTQAEYEDKSIVSAYQPDENVPVNPINYITDANLFVNNLKPMVKPLSATQPLLDAFGIPTDGKTISLQLTPENKIPINNNFGVGIIRNASDSPQTPILFYSPKAWQQAQQLKQVTKVTIDTTYKSYFIVWTGTNLDEVGKTGNALYSIIAEQPWQVKLTYTVGPLVIKNGKPQTTLTPAANNDISHGKYDIKPIAVPAEGLMEVCKPTILQRVGVENATK